MHLAKLVPQFFSTQPNGRPALGIIGIRLWFFLGPCKAYSPRFLFCIFYLDCWFKRKRYLVCFDLFYEALFYSQNYFGNYTWLFSDPFPSNMTSALVHLEFVLKYKWVSWVVCCRRVPLSLKSTIKKKYTEEISRWISCNH